jgi:hypothetical protein
MKSINGFDETVEPTERMAQDRTLMEHRELNQ